MNHRKDRMCCPILINKLKGKRKSDIARPDPIVFITGYKLTLCKEKAMLNLCIFAEYALEIFNNLSDKANYN